MVSPDGSRVFVTGSSATVAYRADTGARLWLTPTTAFAGSGGSTPPPTVTVSPDGTKVFVAGTTGGPGPGRRTGGPTTGKEDYATFAYDAATGRQVWEKRYNGPADGADSARSVAVSPKGDTVFVNGISEGAGSGPDFATVAYKASTGAQLWAVRYDGPGNGDEVLFPTDAGQSLAVSRDGVTVFVTGGSKGAAAGHDYATVAYDASTGARRWVNRYSGGGGDSSATSVAVSPAGVTVFVTGSSSGGATGADTATVAYNAATGAQLWVTRYNGPASRNEGAISLVVEPRGERVFVAGTSEGPTPGKEDYATVGYNAVTGAQLWVKRFNGPANGDDNAASVAVSHDGAKVVVTGWSSGATSAHEYATVVYQAATGTQLWAALYPGAGSGNNEGRSVAVSPRSGAVFVTGSSGDGYATVAYRG